MRLEKEEKQIEEYLNSNLSKWIKQDIENVKRKNRDYKLNEEDSALYYQLKQAIYDLCISMKAEVVTGELSSAKNEELKNFFWGLIV